MSWEPVTLWALRCDGDTTRGQCSATLHYLPDSDEDNDPVQALTSDRTLTTWRPALHSAGWLTAGPRLLCPAHIAAAAYLCAADIDGLPFSRNGNHTASRVSASHRPPPVPYAFRCLPREFF